MPARSIAERARSDFVFCRLFDFRCHRQLIVYLVMISDSRCRFYAGVRPTWRLIVVVASASFFVGCAMQPTRLPISYLPQQNVQPVKDADVVPVQVKVEDLQPQTFNHFMENPHFLVKDAAETIKDAAETELKARGFKIGDGGAIVIVQLGRLEATCETDNFSMYITSRGSLSMRVQVQPQAGKVLYSRNIGGEAKPMYSFLWVGKCATPELQGSLADAFKGLFADPDFTTAILATRQPPPAKPVSPARIAGAFATMSRR
jgi:uncharacterized lipoprotein YajG